MKLFSRRKAVTLAASAPLAAGAMRTAPYPIPPPTAGLVGSYPEYAKDAASSLGRLVAPTNLPEYYKAVGESEKAWRFFDNRRDMQRYRDGNVSPNIACLKSVSYQHKFIMHMREVDRINDERKSFVEKMLDSFGVRDYFKKMEEQHGGAEASSNRY